MTESIAHLGKDVSKQMWKNIFSKTMTDLTEFQKIKIKEWEEFANNILFHGQEKLKILGYMLFVLFLSFH